MNKLIPMVVMATIAVVLIGSMLMPIITDYNEDETNTYTNNIGQRAKMLDISGSHTFEIVDSVLQMDGVDMTIPSYQMAISSDKFNLRKYPSSWSINCSQGTGNTLDITISDGKFSGTIGAYTYTDESLAYLAYYDTAGEYVIVLSDANPRTIYLNDPVTQFLSANWISTTSEWFSYYGGALTVDGVANDSMSFVGTMMDADTKVYAYSTSGGITFVVDNAGEDYTVHPYVCVVPYQVTGMTAVNHQIFSILFAIPAILIVSLIVGVAAIVLRGRN